MNIKYYSLEINKSNKLTRTFQLILGILCIFISIGWLIMNFKVVISGGTIWISIIFLLGFGYYQVNSGLGRGEKFIEVHPSQLRLKTISLLPVQEIPSSAIAKTELYPLSVIFFLKSGKKVKIRFGTTYTDIIDPLKQEIEDFCSRNKIDWDYMNDDL